MTDHFTTVSTMIEELRSSDPEQRLSSMRGIHLIAQTLGPDRTKSELIPYLTDYIDDNDEVLRVFANALATMIPEVGGIHHASSLLNPLETLCSLDEVTVRDEAVSSLGSIGDALFRADAAALQQEFVTLVLRLGKSELPQGRSSACYLIATPYPHVQVATKATLRQGFLKLCADEEIMVRRSACVALGKNLAKCLGQQCVDFLTSFSSFCRDSSDGVRLQAVPTAVAILPLLPDSGVAQVTSLLKTLSSDSSWRVRYMVADRLGDISKALSQTDLQKTLIPVFKSLTQDAEPEIRASAVFNMQHLLAVPVDANSKKDVVVNGTRLLTDQNAHVRMSLASALLKCATLVTKDLWSSSLVPACIKLLQDTDADVRLAVVSSFSSLGNTQEAKELAPKLVPVVLALTADPKWRIREVVVGQIPSVVSSLGRSADEMMDAIVKGLSDRVATIRAASTQSVCRLVVESGVAWARTALLPKLAPLALGEGFTSRVTFLQVIAALLPNVEVDAGFVQGALWPLMSALCADRVANVRVNASKVIVLMKKFGKCFPAAEAALLKLAADEDQDVKIACK
jgi:serine/threonine-protein phosphatase 2A regulatory subunit A